MKETFRYPQIQLYNTNFTCHDVKSSKDLENLTALGSGGILAILDSFENFSSKETAKNFTSDLISKMDAVGDNIFFLIATNRVDLIDERLRNNGRFEVEIEIPVPTAEDRKKVLDCHLRKIKSDDPITIEQIERIAAKLHGFVISDVCSLVKRAFQESLARSKNISPEMLIECSKSITPSAMKSVAVNVEKIFWKDIGGSDRIRISLQQLIEWPLKYPQQMAQLGIKAPRGVLLYGPPGCSKTMVAKALATETDLKFLTIKGRDKKWIESTSA